MPTSEKVDKVEELTAAMSNAKAIYLADFTGLDVAKVTGLRNKLREAEVGYQVVKNRLAKRAAAEAGIAGLDEHLIGPTAIAYTNEDPIAPAKILQDFADEDDDARSRALEDDDDDDFSCALGEVLSMRIVKLLLLALG